MYRVPFPVSLMAKKKKKSSRSLVPRTLTDIWNAGMGAMTSARNAGADGFDTLVSRGRALAESGGDTARSVMSGVEHAASAATGKAVSVVRGAGEGTVETVQGGVEAVVERVLGALGLPGRNEVVELQKQVEALQLQIGALRREAAASAAPAASSQPVKGRAPRAGTASSEAKAPLKPTGSKASAPTATRAASPKPAATSETLFTVAPHPDGWAVRREGAERALSVHATKKEATLAGRQAAKAAAPSRLTLHRVDDSPGEVIEYAPPDDV